MVNPVESYSFHAGVATEGTPNSYVLGVSP